MITVVQPVTTGQGGHGYVVYRCDHPTAYLAGKARFVRRDGFTPDLGAMLGPYVLLDTLAVPMGEWYRLCRMPGIGDPC